MRRTKGRGRTERTYAEAVADEKQEFGAHGSAGIAERLEAGLVGDDGGRKWLLRLAIFE